ncbi:MAG: MgtC/SapB family protein [Bacilli bacterium]|nr:MgtC/SapB family protein [Bacilli bacterium]
MDFIDFLLRLSVCFLLSFILGVERQYRRRSLGLRTMILVSIGSYMFVSFSFMVTGYQSDISRIAAQVVAGIGFLGAGVIIKDNEKNRVSGLTTAATLWCDAGIGVLCAGGFISEALVATLFVLFANIILREINKIINNRVKRISTTETFNIILRTNDNNKIMEYITNMINRDSNLSSNNIKVTENKITFNIIVKKSSEKKVDTFVNNLVYTFNIKDYEYKKIEEIELEESDEL